MAKFICRRPFLYTRKVDGKPQPPVLYPVGAEIDFEGLPSDNLEPADAEAEAMAEKARAHFAEERQRAAVNASAETRAMAAALARLLGKDPAAAIGDEPATPPSKGVPIHRADEEAAAVGKGLPAAQKPAAGSKTAHAHKE